MIKTWRKRSFLNLIAGNKVKQYRKVIQNSINNSSEGHGKPINLRNYWNINLHTQYYIETCQKFTRSFSTKVPELKSNQEKAGTQLVLQNKDACGSSIKNILVVSANTDVIAVLIPDLLSGSNFKY